MATSSFGATIGYDTAGGTSFTNIGHVKDIAGPNLSRGSVDVTDHDSTDGFKDFLGGLTDGGEVTFVINFDHTASAHSSLYTSFAAQTLWSWQVTLNTASGSYKWVFDGFLGGLSPSAAVEGANTWDLSVKVSGKPTLTAST